MPTFRWSEWRRTASVSGFGRFLPAAIAHLAFRPSKRFMERLLYIGFPAAVTIPLTVLFCRHRLAGGKPTSLGTVLAGTLSATVITLVCMIGTDIFTTQFWIYTWNDPYVSRAGYSIMLSVLVSFCFVVAAFIVGYYTRTRK